MKLETGLPVYDYSLNQPSQRSSRNAVLALLAFILCAISSQFLPTLGWIVTSMSLVEQNLCPQVSALNPFQHAELHNALNQTFGTPEFRNKAVDWLSKLVQIPCAPILRRLC